MCIKVVNVMYLLRSHERTSIDLVEVIPTTGTKTHPRYTRIGVNCYATSSLAYPTSQHSIDPIGDISLSYQ